MKLTATREDFLAPLQSVIGVVERRQIAEAGGHVGVLGAKRLFPNRKGPLKERRGFLVLA